MSLIEPVRCSFTQCVSTQSGECANAHIHWTINYESILACGCGQSLEADRRADCLSWLPGYEVVWTRVPTAAKERCGVGLLDHDVWASGSEWGTARVGRGDVAAAIVSRMKL